MSSKNAEQTAHAADDAYRHAADPDDGDLVEVEASKNLTTVVSVRLSVEDLTLIEQAASRADVKLSAFCATQRCLLPVTRRSSADRRRWRRWKPSRMPCRPCGARQARRRIACSRSCPGGRTRAAA